MKLNRDFIFGLGSTPYLGIDMTAVNLQRLSSIDAVKLITPQGTVIHSYPISLPDGLVENFIIDTEEFRLPSESFFIELEGKDSGMLPFLLTKDVSKHIQH